MSDYAASTRKRIKPVVQSFKDLAKRDVQPRNPTATSLASWDLQVDKAAKDFENHLSKTVSRILGRLKAGVYDVPSAQKPKTRPLDRKDADKKSTQNQRELDKQTKDHIAPMLGLK